jgi:hypothetical protein
MELWLVLIIIALVILFGFIGIPTIYDWILFGGNRMENIISPSRGGKKR